jgi:fatty-acyl-CoA synthase
VTSGARRLYGVPTMFVAEWQLIEDGSWDVSTLQTVRTGIMAGAPCPAELMKKFIAAGIDEMTICYGMTETSPVSTQTRTDDSFERKVGTVGRVCPHLEIGIVDPGTGDFVERGESGEFVHQGLFGDARLLAAARQDRRVGRQRVDAHR